MALDLRDCKFHGHALPEPFARGDLDVVLAERKLLPKTTGPEGKALDGFWEVYRRKLRALPDSAGAVRVASHVLEPLIAELGYARLSRDEDVVTREGPERGGLVLETADGGARLRAWTIDSGADFDAPQRRGQAYRYSPTQIAQRVLLAKGERVGLLTDGTELRILFCDPARRESHVSIELGRAGGWRGMRAVPDSFRLLLALGRPAGVRAVPEIVEQARLQQTRVTDTLREQAQLAVRDFVQLLLDEPRNKGFFDRFADRQDLAKRLFKDALVIVYRLLFILKLEASSDPERSFSFASTSLWRNSYSPTYALAPAVKLALDGGETGTFVSEGLRALFRMFREGFVWSEMRVTKLGGMLFGEGTAPILDGADLFWSERAAVKLLDHLLWTPRGKKGERQRVHYGPLYVEDLGRVYEALLELSPGIATEPMCRLRRQKLEVVVPAAQGEPYRKEAGATASDAAIAESRAASAEEDGDEEDGDEKPGKGKTKVEWIEAIREGAFYLRVGLGRKASGSYYTPQAFVKFLIQETLGPQIEARSPRDNPDPGALLGLKVLDPAMGSGHFLVEACRTLGDALYEACRACDAKAEEAERRANGAETEEQRERFRSEAVMWRRRVVDLPDPNDELVAYLPSRATEGEAEGRSQGKALAICRRLAAVHCLYGVDKNELAVELAKLSLWLESYAEGLPLTFLDHRLLCGDSLTGPFFEKLLTLPSKDGAALEDLFSLGLTGRLTETLGRALSHVRDLEASIGKDEAEIVHKRVAKEKLDAALKPFKLLSAAWSGAVMLGDGMDDDYRALANVVGEGGDVDEVVKARPALGRAIEVGKEGVSYDLVFPEVFWPEGRFSRDGRAGFHAVVGNPPWDSVRRNDDQFFAGFDFKLLGLATKAEKRRVIEALLKNACTAEAFSAYVGGLDSKDQVIDALFSVHKARVKGALAGRGTYDDYMLFAERAAAVTSPAEGRVGMVLPSAFHANEGAVGVRRLYLKQLSLINCYSFENKRLFEIHGSFKFALVVACRGTSEQTWTDCGFYLHDPQWLFTDNEPLRYDLSFVEKTGGEYLSLLELRTSPDRDVAESCFQDAETCGAARQRLGVVMSQEVNMTYDSGRFVPTTKVLPADADPRMPALCAQLLKDGYLVLHEGKTFHQYSDRWDARPRYLVGLAAISDRPAWKRAAHFFRAAFRDIANSTNERCGIFAMLPPGALLGNTAPCEKSPEARPTAHSLMWVSCANSYVFDWNIRQKSRVHINLFILDSCPVPPSAFALPRSLFLAHSALRLSCNHEGYAPLWQEQLGEDTWREATPKHTWPVLAGEDARWAVRAAIDAVVAQAYGLSRDQYAHVLSSFSHKSYPKAPDLCLAAFDELTSVGLEAFTRKHDPYHDIPLVETLPKPAIDLPGALAAVPSTTAAPSPTAASSPTAAAPSPVAVPVASDDRQLSLLPDPPPRKRTRKART